MKNKRKSIKRELLLKMGLVILLPILIIFVLAIIFMGINTKDKYYTNCKNIVEIANSTLDGELEEYGKILENFIDKEADKDFNKDIQEDKVDI